MGRRDPSVAGASGNPKNPGELRSGRWGWSAPHLMGDPCGHQGGGALTCAHVMGRSCAGGGPVATPSPRVARPDPANRIGGGSGGQAREAEAGRGRRWRLCAET